MYGKIVWSWRPKIWRQARGDVAANRRAHRQPRSEGAIVQRSPGEHDISRSNHRAGKAGMFPVALWLFPPVLHTEPTPCAQAAMGASRLPVFPAPFSIGRATPAQLGRHEPREREGVSAIEMKAIKLK